MEGSTDRSARRATELIDELIVGHRELARAQARCAGLMMEFAATRAVCDRNVIAERETAGVEGRYKAGEFAGLEISMAPKESRCAVQRTMVVARRLRADTPDAWDAWRAGDIYAFYKACALMVCMILLWLGVGNVLSIVLPSRDEPIRQRRQSGSLKQFIIAFVVSYAIGYLVNAMLVSRVFAARELTERLGNASSRPSSS